MDFQILTINQFGEMLSAIVAIQDKTRIVVGCDKKSWMSIMILAHGGSA